MGNTPSSPTAAPSAKSGLPPLHPEAAGNNAAPPPGCPMHNSSEPAVSTSADSSVTGGSLNPLNNMPELAQAAVHAAQQGFLSLERTASSIPRSRSNSDAGACPVRHSASGDLKGKGRALPGADDTSDDAPNWVYPSPQQFYNALARKGKEAPEESIDMMVQIHNWMNEKAWDEIRRWEDRRHPEAKQGIELARFEGRPQDLSPKARLHLFLAGLFPERYSSQPPFDRHDWYVRRPWDGSSQRYVIDYYSCPDDEQGNPVFSLDVRPAVDSPTAVYDRMTEWARLKKETWLGTEDRAAGAARHQ